MMPDAFENSRLSIEHAKRHIKALQVEIDAFFDTKPHTEIIEVQPPFEIIKFKMLRPLPHSIGLIAFDAANSLRAALDQAGFDVAIANNTRGKKAHFPFGLTAMEVASRHSRTSRDLPKEIFDVMAAFQPYKGGNNLLWALNQICNSHKHEILTSTALHPGSGDVRSIYFSGLKHFPIPPIWDRAKNEMVIAVIKLGSDFHYDLNLGIYVTFADIDFLSKITAEEVLDKLANMVESIVAAIEAESRRIGLIK